MKPHGVIPLAFSFDPLVAANGFGELNRAESVPPIARKKKDKFKSRDILTIQVGF